MLAQMVQPRAPVAALSAWSAPQRGLWKALVATTMDPGEAVRVLASSLAAAGKNEVPADREALLAYVRAHLIGVIVRDRGATSAARFPAELVAAIGEEEAGETQLRMPRVDVGARTFDAPIPSSQRPSIAVIMQDAVLRGAIETALRHAKNDVWTMGDLAAARRARVDFDLLVLDVDEAGCAPEPLAQLGRSWGHVAVIGISAAPGVYVMAALRTAGFRRAATLAATRAIDDVSVTATRLLAG